MNKQDTVIKNFNKEEYKKVVADAIKALGKKHFVLIVHGSSFPSACSSLNTGIGSPNSEGAKQVVKFAEGIFNGIQLGPAGKTKSIDSSPYTGTIFSNNPLFIDLHDLTKPEWTGILSEKTVSEIIENNPNKGQNKTAYSYIFAQQEKALREAYNTFKKKLSNIDSLDKDEQKVLKEIKEKFNAFVEENNFWLEKDALYEALTVKHNNDYWPVWKDETDKGLFNPKNENETKACTQRIAELKKDFAEEIEYYNFCQFAADLQKQEIIKFAQASGIKLIADRQVAFSDRDCWANQALFLEGWRLGCPPDLFSDDGQAWDFPVMDPEKLFNPDGTLGEGGKVLKAVYKKMFKENPGGVRIDHTIGLIDPWVYKAGRKPKYQEGAGRLYSSPEHPELGKYAIAALENLDYEYDADSEYRIKSLNNEQIHKYAALIEKIIIASAKEVGQDKNSIICEDLGTLTFPVVRVMDTLDLSGMSLTQFVVPEKPEHPYRGINTASKTWIMVGTHDNEPIARWAKAQKGTHEGYLHAKNLAEDLVADPNQRECYITALLNDEKELTIAKFVELFTSSAENIQIFFADLLGINDVYNKPGTSGDQNWSLRMPDNFEEFYYEQLSKGKGANLPEILKRAFEVKGHDFVQKYADLFEKLGGYAATLKS